MKNITRKVGRRFLTFLLAFVLAFSLVIPASMADNENEDTEEEEVVVDADTEETEIAEDEEAVPEEEETDDAAEVDADADADAEAVELNNDSENEIMTLASDPDNAYLSALSIRSMVDGQSPWDDDDEPGNDSSDSNGIVRAFDYVNYTLSFTTALKDQSETVDSADLYVEFTLPCGPETAQFNMNTMNWMQSPVTTYVLDDGSTKTAYDQDTDKGRVVEQILTGYRTLSNDGETPLIPGAGTLSTGIYVSAATNGTTLVPTFSAWINNESAEKITVESDLLTISAAQKYNIVIRQASEMNIKGTYDISTGNNDAAKVEVSDEKNVLGRMEGYGITVMMQNDTDKGLKGLEFPTADITFDITLKEQAENASGADLSRTTGFTPVIWDYDANLRRAETGQWARQWVYTNTRNRGLAYRAAPYNKIGCTSYSTVYDSCYDGGDWYMEQDKEDPLVYHVTIKNYTIDYENYNFPTGRNTWYERDETDPGTDYTADQACLSSGVVQMILQYPAQSEIPMPTYIYYTMTADNFKVGDVSYSASYTYHNTYELVPEGSIESGSVFTDDTATNRATTSHQLGSDYQAGDAYSFIGSNIRLWGYVGTSTDDTVRTNATLIKFDANAFEINRDDAYFTDGYYNHGSGDGKVNSWVRYFAGRGENWESDQVMSDTLINSTDLHYYEDLDTLESKGYTCVGVLYIADVENQNDNCQSQGMIGLTIKDDAALINNVYAACSDAWASYSTMDELREEYGAFVTDDGTINTNWARHGYNLYKAYCDLAVYETMKDPVEPEHNGDYWYHKTEYDSDGNITGGHNVGYYGGTSLLICGEKCSVDVKFDQAVYDLDAGQRTAAVTVQPAVNVDGNASSGTGDNKTTTDVVVTVTLPADLTYDIGSAYYGTTPITPVVETDSEGNTVLTFTLRNVTVGESMPEITFTTTIGHAGTAEDVENNDSVSITAEIQSTNDRHSKDTAFGNVSNASFNVVRLSLLSISKEVDTAMIEMDGEFTWTYRFGNAAEEPETDVRMADRLPYDGDENGSSFSGSYEITDIILDFSDAEETFTGLEDMHFYVTNEDIGESSGDLAEEPEEDFWNWSNLLAGATVSGSTVTLNVGNMGNMTAFDFFIGTVYSNEYVSFTMHVKTTGNEPGDVYRNVVDEGGNEEKQASIVASNIVDTYVAKRTISGLTWYDENKDGIRQDDEKLLSGIGVSLYRTEPSDFSETSVPVMYIRNDKGMYIGLYTAYDVYGEMVGATKTLDLSTGEYEFDCLEAGTYYVLFDNVSDYVLTELNAGNDPARDSDAHAVYSSNGALSEAYISDIELRALDEMDRYLEESIDQDAGFYNATVNVTVYKDWDDNENQDGKRPESIEVVLTGTDGSMHFYDVTEEDGWELTISDLPGYYNGVEIEYSLHEVSAGEYTPEVVMEKTEDGYIFTITNNYIPAVIDIPVVKIWDDDENRDNVRPESVTVTLTGSDGETYEATLDESNGWAYLFKDLPEYYNEGTEIAYTLTESSVDDYTSKIEPYLEGYGFTVTNSHEIETTEVTVTKDWDDNNDQDGIRPTYVIVRLDGSDGNTYWTNVRATDGWTYTFKDLPKYIGGEEIVYTASEFPVDGYTVTQNGYAFTNSHKPETTGLSVQKVWDDNDDQDGIRPDEVTITVSGTEGSEYYVTYEMTLNEQNGWYDTLTGLPVYNDGEKIVYSVEECSVDDYSTVITKSADGYQFTVTNSHTPDTINIPVEKIWDDSNNLDGARPEAITVILSGSDGSLRSLILAGSNDWQGTFTNLPANYHGEEIVYSVREEYVYGYTGTVTGSAEDGYIITNSHIPYTTNVSVTKVWDDNNDQDGIRPDSIEVTLTGSNGYTGTADLTKDNGYYYVFTDLDMYDNGVLVDYDVTEAAVDGYGISSYVKSADGYQITITNRHTPDVTSITVNKDWDDSDNMDGIRPAAVTVILSGTDGSVHEAVLSEANGWTYTFENLPVKDSGKDIEYSVHEEYVDGYTDAVTENDDGSFTVTNSHKPATTNVSVTKEWNDGDDQDGIRPTEVYVTLTGTATDETVYDETVALTADNGYYYVFTGLPVYSNGVLIDYSVTEADVEGYTARIIEGSDGYTFTVRNSHTPEKTSVTVSKAWDDDDDRDGIRPGSLTVILTGGNESYMAVLSDSNNWTYTFTNLPVYADGEKITYQATEFAVSGYDGDVTQIDDYTFTLTNKHEPETTSISGLKTWDDADNQDGIRPSEITVNLFADGDYVTSTTVTADGGWYYSFDNLTKYRDGGEEIVYTVTETLPDDVAGEYTGTVSGTNFTNSHTPYTVDIPVWKVWSDNDDQDGIRTSVITVYLSGSDGSIYVADLTAENDWYYVFEDLPLRHNGVDITYSLHEAAVDGYTAEVVKGEDGHSFTVTNSYVPAVIDIPVAKVWDDNDNQDGIRPDSIEVTLEGSDGSTYTAELTKDNGYMAMFEGLPMYYDHGTLIDYELSEETISEYQGTVTKDGTGYAFTVENSHVPYTTEVTVEKVWNDDDNRDGIRPDSIDVTLTGSDGSIYEATLTADNGWTYTFTDLPVNYAEGTKIVYDLTEADIDGYEATITKSADGYAFTVENTHEPKLREIPVTKVWVDNDDALGYRPEEIEVTLTGTAGGETVYENTVTITADDDWTYLFENLFVYENGQQITYTVSETPVVDYYTDIDGSMRSGYEITNTVIDPKLDKALAEDDYERKEAEGSDMHQGEDTEGDGFGTWDDADNNQEVTFHLTLSDIKGAVNLSVHDYLESEFVLELDTVDVILYEGETGYYLKEDEDYTLSEGECSDPDCIMAGCTFEVRFSDDVFQDISPDAYIVVTYRSLTDTHVDDYEDFVDQIYNEAYILYGTSALMHRSAIAVTETDLFGFEVLKYVDEGSELIPLEEAGFTLSRADGMYAVLETETGSDGNEYYLVTGWTDDIGYAGILVSGTDGMIRVEGLDDDTYMLDEMAPPAGYYELEASIAFTITEEGTLTDCDSLLEIENATVVGVENEKILTSVTGTKTWDDSDNLDGMRPDEITVRLYADGEEVDSTTVTAADDWTYTFEDLVAYKDGEEIVYTITEDEVDGYTTAYDGYDIVNTHETEKTSVSVTKVWDDEDDADGIRPDRITVILTADGQMTGYYLVLNEDNGWTGTFENLDKYADGNLIQYDIYEPTVDGYKSTLTGSAADGFILTNAHTPDKNDNGGNGGNGGNDGGTSGGGDNGGNTGTTGGNTGTTGGTTGSNPSSSGSGTTGTGNVKTGEIIGMSAAGLAALAAIAGIVVALTTRKRRINEEISAARRLADNKRR